MLFFDTPDPAPNPRRVRIFAGEKGIALPTQTVAIAKGEHRQPDYLAVNPLGQTPSLKLDDGEVLTESVAICRYLEGLHPEPPLFGCDALDAARIEMWSRRVEMRLMVPVSMVWVHTHAFTARITPRFTEWGEANKPRIQAAFEHFDERLRESRYLTGDHFTMADILLLTTADFSAFIGEPFGPGMAGLARWHQEVSARPSVSGVREEVAA